jgi:hypothetical protein
MTSAQYNSQMKVHNLACRNDIHRSFHWRRKITFEQIFVNRFKFSGIISTVLVTTFIIIDLILCSLRRPLIS